MKIKYILSIVVAGSVLISGCKKSFLDAQPQSGFLTPEQIQAASKQDPGVLVGSLTGLYSAMYTDFVGGTTRHDDFGQKGIDIYSDMLSSDMVLAALNYGWYAPVARYQSTVDFTTNEDYIPFRYYYKIIFGANTVMDVLGGSSAVPTTNEDKYTMGQAKTLRAYAYFYLSQLYATGYGSGNDKILPIYTTAKKDSLNQPKSTAKQVWDLMVSDLTDATSLLQGFNRSAVYQVDQNVAKGLLAYVLAARGTQSDWTQVATLTQDIMNNYPITSRTETVYDGTNLNTSGFNNAATPSWMWGVDLTLKQGLDLVSWWGQVDLFTYSYAWAGDPKTIDEGLYNAIRPDDIRKNQFDPPNGGLEATYGYSPGDFDYMPLNKFFDPGRIDGGQREVTTDYIYMRADEFYLLNAEANTHISQEGTARQVLSNFLSERLNDVSYISSLSGQALLDEIYLQTRIELWGEGKSYLAMKRNKATVTRGANHLFFAGQSFTYNDPKLTFVIPQAEVLNNPNLNK